MNTQNIETRLYLFLPPLAPPDLLQAGARLEELAQQLDIACVAVEYDADEQNMDAIKTLINTLQQKGIAVVAGLALLPSEAEQAHNRDKSAERISQIMQLGFDGLHLLAGDREALAFARAELGQNAIIGAACGSSRHLAMELAEAGADYVAFSSDEGSALTDLVDWWQTLFEIPCVAANITKQEQAAELFDIPADFIALDHTMWQDETDIDWLRNKCPAKEAV